jgi:small RNA 2'-O-methyltransferase
VTTPKFTAYSIEHLPPEIFPLFAPVLLGVYHPKALLITTPSYTYNARFTAPDTPKSARKGFPDPTGRTDRVFRHHDHKFEWTLDEFRSWCDEVAAEWGYEVVKDSIGRAQEKDEWGRDAVLGGASQVAAFRRSDDETVRGVSDREKRARELVAHLQSAASLNSSPHVLLARHIHSAHRNSKQPASFLEIGDKIKAIMQGYHEAFMRLEELWFEKDVPEMCGGYMEVLVRAVEEHADLSLRKEIRDGKLGDKPEWMVDLLGAVPPKELWPVQDDESMELPVEQAYTPSTSDDDSSERGHDSADADVSWNEWEPEESHDVWGTAQWSNVRLSKESGWGKAEQSNEKVQQWVPESIMSATSSTAGWDGDYSDSGDTTS